SANFTLEEPPLIVRIAGLMTRAGSVTRGLVPRIQCPTQSPSQQINQSSNPDIPRSLFPPPFDQLSATGAAATTAWARAEPQRVHTRPRVAASAATKAHSGRRRLPIKKP